MNAAALQELTEASDLLRWLGWFIVLSWVFFGLRMAARLARTPAAQRRGATARLLLGLLVLAILCGGIGLVLLAGGAGTRWPALLQATGALACDGEALLRSATMGPWARVPRVDCLRADGTVADVSLDAALDAGLFLAALLLTGLMWLGKHGMRRAPLVAVAAPPAQALPQRVPLDPIRASYMRELARALAALAHQRAARGHRR